MTPTDDDVERVLTAAETIEESLGVLARYQSMNRREYRNDRVARDVVERRFVKATEAALDVAGTLAVHERGSVPDSNPGTMRALAAEGVVTETTAESMAQAARFRNVLAHTYGDVIDHDAVYDALQDLERYRAFLGEVRTYLGETGGLDR